MIAHASSTQAPVMPTAAANPMSTRRTAISQPPCPEPRQGRSCVVPVAVRAGASGGSAFALPIRYRSNQ